MFIYIFLSQNQLLIYQYSLTQKFKKFTALQQNDFSTFNNSCGSKSSHQDTAYRQYKNF